MRLRILAAVLAVLAVVGSGAIGAAQPAAAQTPNGPVVTANASATSSATMVVTFTAVEGALGYLVVPQRLRADGEWTALVTRVERLSARRPVVFDGLANGTTYRACVAAIMPDGARTGLSTSAVPYGLPGAPAIGSVDRSDDRLIVTWSPAAANGRQVTAYEVTVAPDDGIPPLVVGGNESSATIRGLQESTEYTVSVRATNLRGQGPAGQSAAAVVETSGTWDGAPPAIITVAAVGPSAPAESDGNVADLRFVSEAGACAGAVAASDEAGDPVDTSPPADAAPTETDTATAARPPAVRRPPAAGPEDAVREEPAPAPAPAPTAPAPPAPAPEAAPEAAPEVAAPAPAPAATSSGRTSTPIWLALAGLAALVIGGVVVQQRVSARAESEA